MSTLYIQFFSEYFTKRTLKITFQLKQPGFQHLPRLVDWVSQNLICETSGADNITNN